MKTNNVEKYSATKDKYGNDYLCPFTDKKVDNNVSGLSVDECFEKDVFERYAGNIDIADGDV